MNMPGTRSLLSIANRRLTMERQGPMNRYDRERPETGGASAAINRAINTGKIGPHWQTFDYWHYMRHEMRRALLGVDPPTAWCGERNARLRRIIEKFRSLPAIPLPL